MSSYRRKKIECNCQKKKHNNCHHSYEKCSHCDPEYPMPPVHPFPSTLTENNAHFTTPGPQTVLAGANVVLNNNIELNGTGIFHTPGTPEIILEANRTYFATYEASTNLGLNNEGTARLQFNLNGSLIPGTQSFFNFVGLVPIFPESIRVSHSSAAIFSTGPLARTLTLANTSGHPITVEGTNINIFELDEGKHHEFNYEKHLGSNFTSYY